MKDAIEQIIFSRDGDWYFYDEIHEEYGPYSSKQIAMSEAKHYVKQLNRPNPDKKFID